MDLVQMFQKCMLFNVQCMFTFGHFKNVHLMQKIFYAARDVLLSLTRQVKIFLRWHYEFYFCYL